MERQVDLKEISDGKLYGLEDMVRADCAGCAGCSACCRGMGNSVVLDPFDVYRLVNGTGIRFEGLLQNHLELNVVDGVILPNLKMAGASEACAFLSEEGRCTVHAHRPGICRIFPLGRYYENHDFKYFLQKDECVKILYNLQKVFIRQFGEFHCGKCLIPKCNRRNIVLQRQKTIICSHSQCLDCYFQLLIKMNGICHMEAVQAKTFLTAVQIIRTNYLKT